MRDYIAAGLEPRVVFTYFEEICGIPHGSGNTKAVSDYLVAFAKEQGLQYQQDELNNVIMVKEATVGYENAPTVILQGHMDMVCEKEADVDFDFEKDGLQLRVEGDWLSATGTTLGGDDGIAVAYIMALFAAQGIPHPRLEAIITVDEETGMDGAVGIDLSSLQGRRLINLDSEEEGYLLVGCAGGARADVQIPYSCVEKVGTLWTLNIKGLLGGHSGVEIHRQRGNSNVLVARVADAVVSAGLGHLVQMDGGLKDNAIPRYSQAKILVEAGCEEALEALLKQWAAVLKDELAGSDPQVTLQWEVGEAGCYAVVSEANAAQLFAAALGIPNGVQAMSQFIPDLVETSLNLGIMEMGDGILELRYAVRSSVKSAKEALLRKIRLIGEAAGGRCSVSGDYPPWPYRQDSPLRDQMVRIYEEMYGKTPEVQMIHAGLECGLLSDKLPGLDCVSMGPDMKDIHTPAERISISSVGRCWEYLLRVLAETKE